MKAFYYFVFALFVANCNAQSSSSTSTITATGATTSLPAECAGNCIGGDCPIGYSCNTVTQQCCLSTSISTTASTACVDKVGPKGYSDCPERVFLCNNTLYYSLMTDQCPKTCNRCGGSTASSIATTASGSCVDKTKFDGTSDCPGLTRLCNNTDYYNLMTDQCPKTCGRCNGASTTA